MTGASPSGTPAPPADPLVAEFLDYVRYERGLSPNTVSAYGRDLASFQAFLAVSGVPPGKATAEDVRAYFAGSGGDGAASSVARRTSPGGNAAATPRRVHARFRFRPAR